jgi:hypothetical protein
MSAKKLGKREAKKMLTQMFDELSKQKGKKVADKFLLGSGELAERLSEDDTGGNAKQFFKGVGKGLLGLGTGGVEVAGSCGGCGSCGGSKGGVRVAGGKDHKAGKIMGKVLSFGLGEKPKKKPKAKSHDDKRVARGDVIRAVMRESKGKMTLGEASHYVKEHNLW